MALTFARRAKIARVMIAIIFDSEP